MKKTAAKVCALPAVFFERIANCNTTKRDSTSRF